MSEKIFFPLTNEVAANAKTSFASRFITTTAILGAAFVPNAAQAEEKNAKQLPTVTVIDSQSNKSYNSVESSNPKITGSLRDTPRSVTTVTRQLMDDQGVTKLTDALRNVPGVSIAAGEGSNQGDNITIRGFSARSDFFVDGMRDFGSYFRDAFNMESIEVVQGPSSVLFGRGSTGGIVQQNTKQAFLGELKAGSLMVGTNDTSRATVDVNSKIDGVDGAAFRLNAMTNSNSVAGRDEAKFERNAIAPSLAFGLGTDTRLNINYFHQKEDNVPDYGIPFYAGEPAKTNRSNYYGHTNDFLKTNVDIATVKFEHDFSENLSLRNQTRYARYERDVQISNPSSSNGTTATRSMIIRKGLDTYLGNQTDITSKFSTGGIDHTLVTGLALESESATPNNFSGTAAAVNLANPVLTTFTGSATFNGVTKTKVDTIGVYALDTLKLNKSWELSLGIRYDNMRTNYDNLAATGVRTLLSQTNNVTSYSTGVVYKPAHNGSIYFNHGTSFNPSSESLSLSATTTNLDPEKNTSYEVGTKWDLFKKRVSANAAVFRLDKDNARETVDGIGVLSGSQKVTGLLLQLSGKVTEKWNVMAGYTFMDSRVTKSLVNDFYKNRNLTNTPEHMLSLFTTYTFDSQLQIGGGANFVSERFTSPTAAPDAVSGTTRNIPSYVVFNAMAKYPFSKQIDLQLNVNNITNEFYFDQLRGSNAAIPGEGRVFLLSANFKF
jgi:catecholate siderophore receptor